jgi:hypothetical protein
MMSGGYSDYYGSGTDEFLVLCRKLNTEPQIVLPAPAVEPEQVLYGPRNPVNRAPEGNGTDLQTPRWNRGTKLPRTLAANGNSTGGQTATPCKRLVLRPDKPGHPNWMTIDCHRGLDIPFEVLSKSFDQVNCDAA